VAQTSLRSSETLIARDIRLFGQNVANGFRRAVDWRRRSAEWADNLFASFHGWLRENVRAIIFGLALVLYIGLIGWYILDAMQGRIKGDVVQTGVGGLFGAAIVGLVISPLVALIIFLTILLLNWAFKLLTPIILFVPMLLWVLIYAPIQAVLTFFKLLVLIPLFVLFVITRGIELWRRIFYTCPSRACTYRGLPAYVCKKCGTPNPDLWPNLYGVLWHRCVNCDAPLPTLGVLGRNNLGRRCGGCGIPLLGKHAGRAPERLVAIVGGQHSGKTCYLLMAVNEIIKGGSNGAVRMRGAIDDPEQEDQFKRDWQRLETGIEVRKTSEVAKAFLLYSKVGRSKCQLYLYDAPGEEFASLSTMEERQYLPLLEGVIFLVDPLSLEAIRMGQNSASGSVESFKEVVGHTLGTMLQGARVNREGKIPMRAAVVISKGDLKQVQEQIGDIREKNIAGPICRQALDRWGAAHEMRLIEMRFESVEYFVCSPLGRETDPKNTQPFKGAGVLNPLAWVLTGVRG
jgi:hypothetical protein